LINKKTEVFLQLLYSRNLLIQGKVGRDAPVVEMANLNNSKTFTYTIMWFVPTESVVYALDPLSGVAADNCLVLTKFCDIFLR